MIPIPPIHWVKERQKTTPWDNRPGSGTMDAPVVVIPAADSKIASVKFPIAPVNTPKTIADDPQFQERLPWLSAARLGAEQLPFPVKFQSESLPEPTKAPAHGQHTDELVREVLGYDAEQIAVLRRAGAFG